MTIPRLDSRYPQFVTFGRTNFRRMKFSPAARVFTRDVPASFPFGTLFSMPMSGQLADNSQMSIFASRIDRPASFGF